MNTWLNALSARLRDAGLDLAAPFEVGAANAALVVDEDTNGPRSLFELQRFGLPASLGVVVGNTRALWDHFDGYSERAHPLDHYVVNEVEAAVRVAGVGATPRLQIYYSHRTDYRRPDGGLGAVPIQRIAQHSGLAALSPAHLSVHPVHGPWLGLRAVVVTDLPAVPVSRPATQPCQGCSKPCLTALQRALDPSRDVGLLRSQRWLAVRDACPVGRENRYGGAQIQFHYRVLDR